MLISTNVYWQLIATWDGPSLCPRPRDGPWEAVFTRKETALAMAGVHGRMLAASCPSTSWRITVGPVCAFTANAVLELVPYGPDRVRGAEDVAWINHTVGTNYTFTLAEDSCGHWTIAGQAVDQE